MPSGQVFGFNDVFRAEIGVINARRELQERTQGVREHQHRAAITLRQSEPSHGRAQPRHECLR